MMTTAQAAKDNKELAEGLVLDELFDLTLYKTLREITSGNVQKILDELIPIETKHYAFWQDFYRLRIEKLDFARRLKLECIALVCQIFGEPAVYLFLEAIEVYGIRKYLKIWRRYKNSPLSEAVRTVLVDEFSHEDKVVSGIEEKRITPESIRSIFLGFHDGLVEFVGAVSGFFAAFQDTKSVVIASLTGAAAGALSMAVGVFASSSSEKEIRSTAFEKQRFLSGGEASPQERTHPLNSAILVGVFYLFGAMVPVLPVLFGAKNVLVSLFCGGLAVVVVTFVLSFLSGMQIKKRILINLAMVTLAVTLSYVVGILVKKYLGIQ